MKTTVFACFFFTILYNSQVIGNSKQNEDHSLEEDSKTKLRFLAEDGKEVDFIHDLSELRRTSVIFPPLKTFNGLPPTANV